MALDFPNAPVSGQVFNPGGVPAWQYDGTKWGPYAGGVSGAFVYLGTLTANASAQLDWTSLSLYDAFMFELVNVVPTTDGGASTNYLQMLFQVGGTFQTASYASLLVGGLAAATPAGAFEADGSGVNLSGYGTQFYQTGNAAGQGVSGQIFLHAPNGTANYKSVTGSVRWRAQAGASGGGNATATVGGSYVGGTGIVTAVRFAMKGGGTIATGQIRVYGLAMQGGGVVLPAGAPVLVQRQDVTSVVAAVSFAVDATYDEYELSFFGFRPSGDQQLALQVSQDGGATWRAGTEYQYSFLYFASNTASAGYVGSTGTSGIGLTGTQYSGGTATLASGTIKFYQPAVVKSGHTFQFATYCHNPSVGLTTVNGGGSWLSGVGAINAVRLVMFGGFNIAVGSFCLYGRRK